ncbi:MAG: cation diffusion facilitator family transporter [Anaerolineales bacterium]
MTDIDDGHQEKKSAALTSVIAAVGLTGFKIVVGVLTGSLGILAEAAHSALDLVAAVMTWFAVRISDKPADKGHPFGHHKAENISALFETLLLLLTSVWIIYEAINRLVNKGTQLDVTIWSFLVMGTSIVVDYSRSRLLYRVAEKHNSQALEADALHFSTDIWSSATVILGLIAVLIGKWIPSLAFLESADAIAALAVAMIVIFVSGQLGKRSIEALLDAGPGDEKYKQIVKEVSAIPNVLDVHALRIRISGASWFVDMHIYMDDMTSLLESHEVTEKIEAKVQAILPKSDVTVHVEPGSMAKIKSQKLKNTIKSTNELSDKSRK